MANNDRLSDIKNLLKQNKEVLVSDLSDRFDVTQETIRRDLEKLQEEGFVTRTYGGAILKIDKMIEGIYYFQRAVINTEAKQKIAKNAIRFIRDRYTVGFDSSTTTMELMRLLKDRDDLTIVTNSAVALGEIGQSDFRLYSTGGVLNKRSLSLQGPIAMNTACSYNLDALIIGCKGICKQKGIFDTDEREAEIKRQFIRHSNKIILLIDHTKFDNIAFVKVADLSDIDVLITDVEPDLDWKNVLKELDIELVY